MDMAYYQSICGDRRASVKLATIYVLRDLVESGSVADALRLIDTITMTDERRQLRAVRQEIYNRLRHARQMHDEAEIARCTEMLQLCTDAARDIAV